MVIDLSMPLSTVTPPIVHEDNRALTVLCNPFRERTPLAAR
jgi:hypothetical protein